MTIGSSRQIANTYRYLVDGSNTRAPTSRCHTHTGGRTAAQSWVIWVMRVTLPMLPIDVMGNMGHAPAGLGACGTGRVRNGAGGARGVIWAKYPAGKNRSHTYTCYVITSHLEVHRLDDRRYPSNPIAGRRSGAALPNTRATRLSRDDGRYGHAHWQ